MLKRLPLTMILAAAAVAGCSVPDARRAPPRRIAAPVAAPAPARPAWQARKVVPDAVTVPGGRLHTVKAGETGIAIAQAYGVPWRTIVDANKLSPPYVLQIGQNLMLPSNEAVATMSVEARAKAFNVEIDDIITGGSDATAATAPAKPPRAPPPAVLPNLPPGTPRFEWPVAGRVLSGFGAKPGGRFNDGVNLKANAGAPVRAAADGVVVYAGDGIPGFGNLILLKHAGGYVTAYAHNQALLVDRGKMVKRGEAIARAGATGAVTEPQVHFELRRDRQPVDPTTVIAGR